MPNRKVELANKYLTAPQVQRILKLSRWQFNLRIDRGLFPKPTLIDTNGVRYFDRNWINIAKAILEQMP